MRLKLSWPLATPEGWRERARLQCFGQSTSLIAFLTTVLLFCSYYTLFMHSFPNWFLSVRQCGATTDTAIFGRLDHAGGSSHTSVVTIARCLVSHSVSRWSWPNKRHRKPLSITCVRRSRLCSESGRADRIHAAVESFTVPYFCVVEFCSRAATDTAGNFR